MRKLFIGRLSRRTRTADVEEVFERYGRLSRCDVKYGQDTAYAFVDYDNDRDAEDAVKSENGRKLLGATMVVEWSKGFSRRSMPSGRPGDECYRCGRPGHFGRDCRMSGFRSYGRGRSPVIRRSRYSRSRSRSRSYGRRSRSRRRSRSNSRSRSRSLRRSRSRSARRSRSKTPRISRSKSPRRSRSKSPRRMRSKSPRRSRSKSPRRQRSKSPRRSRSAQRSGSMQNSRSPNKMGSRSPRASKSPETARARSRSQSDRSHSR
ncbi:serine/arginine-rich splicing factor 7-like [Watersipora subatra]|uniref:serine/arginine-rich splicing factor 7-like n=1 Tax=Watersipora subatra TaxID=2589382 RepID=UPI00355C00A9